MFLLSVPADFIPIFFQLLVAIGFAAGTMLVTHKLTRQTRDTDEKLDAFECGVEQQGNARLPFSIKYFLTAILFVLFDVEIIFFYPWAVNFSALGIWGFLKMLLFVAPLLMGFYYVIKKGVLNWD